MIEFHVEHHQVGEMWFKVLWLIGLDLELSCVMATLSSHRLIMGKHL